MAWWERVAGGDMTKLTLLLAQGPESPDGDLDDRLVLNMGLTQQGQIDPGAYDNDPEPWMALRERNGGQRALEIVRVDEGWALQSADSLDDPVWAFEGHVFRPGELVRLRRPDGEQLLFRIVASES